MSSTRPLVGWVIRREDFEESGFTSPVAADDPDDFAAFDFEGDVAEGPDDVVGFARGRETGDGGPVVSRRSPVFSRSSVVKPRQSPQAAEVGWGW